jgi:hypothetical protein
MLLDILVYNLTIIRKLISKTFREKLNKLLKEEGYEVPDSANLNIFLKKDGKIVGPLTFGYKNNKDYSEKKMYIECPEELKEKLEKL